MHHSSAHTAQPPSKSLGISSATSALLFLLVPVISCGGDTAQEEAESAPSQPAAAAPAPAAPAPTGAIDEDLAARGATLFQSKGCQACHTVGGGRHTGPDLKGVIDRREFPWVLAMITNPDSMLKNDQAARQLLSEYMTPMLSMGINADEARAIYEFLRRDGQ